MFEIYTSEITATFPIEQYSLQVDIINLWDWILYFYYAGNTEISVIQKSDSRICHQEAHTTLVKPATSDSLHENSWVNAGHFWKKSQHYNGINCGPTLAIAILCWPKPPCQHVFVKAAVTMPFPFPVKPHHGLDGFSTESLICCLMQRVIWQFLLHNYQNIIWLVVICCWCHAMSMSVDIHEM